MAESDGNKDGGRGCFSPQVFFAIYALTVPLALGVFALWLPLKTAGVQTLKDWQTLVGGVLAIVAAVVGGSFVYNQTAVARRQEKERVTRHHAAARAVLPLALSGMVEYVEQATVELEALRATAAGHRVRGGTVPPFAAPKLDAEIIGALRDVIEGASKEIGERVAQVIRDFQVLDANLRTIPKRVTPFHTSLTTFDLDSYQLRTAEVFARCNDLFAYARGEEDGPPAAYPTVNSLTSALTLLGLNEITHKTLFENAVARAARHASGERGA
ncbi:hypothetical protein ACFODL_18625 [Phenylobacterium terrae]|uniref:Uncharacterized protein n=1 Tax=Phenylobacterium terrae TaxID=2665495 RepID=A0ABW4N2R7_9CAUL